VIAASWTLKSEKDAMRCTEAARRVSHRDPRALALWPGARRAGVPNAEPGGGRAAVPRSGAALI